MDSYGHQGEDMILVLMMILVMMFMIRDGGSDDTWQKIETCPADTSVFRDLDVRFVRSAISYLLEGPPIYMFVSVLPDLRLIFTSSYTIIFFNQM